ncbi:integrase [Gossypium australe]|uniref:Integrase n=1 Tax=Gossypium australe TaxID=47621 RepID=A0A5B6WDZ5_9ROSI|nr:integrase [Gossypium australe]
MNTQLTLSDDGSILAELKAKLVFLHQICEAQKYDNELQAKRMQCESTSDSDYQIGFDDCLMFRDRICIPKNSELIQKILHEAHNGCLSIHPGSTKIVTMDFISGLPLSPKKKYAIWLSIEHKDGTIGDRLFLKVSPWKKILRFGRKGKLSLRFIGPYEVIERIGPVAYWLALPLELEKIHNLFHVLMLRRYRSDPSDVISPTEIEVQFDMTFNKEPIRILARKVKELRNKHIALMNVLCQKHGVEEAT